MKVSIIAIILSAFAAKAFAENNVIEYKNITQPPVITSEFKVKQGNQALYSDLEKDTDQITLEDDLFGLKTLQKEMTPEKIKERFIKEREKLGDESTHLERYPYPKNHK